MSFKAIANKVTSHAGRQILKVQKHSPALMFGAGVVGVAATVVLACRATLKVEGVIDSFDEKKGERKAAYEKEPLVYTEDVYKRDLSVLYLRHGVEMVKLYGPALLVGFASVAALAGSHVVLNQRIAGVTAAYAALDKGFKEYRGRVVEELGTDKDQEFRYGTEDIEVVEETPDGTIVVKTVKAVKKGEGSIYARSFDEVNSTQWQKEPMYNQMFLRGQQNYANDMLNANGHVLLNDVYQMLGMKRTKEGCVVGWVKNPKAGKGDNYIDFGVFNGDVYSAMRFVNGDERSVLLDFNVDGVVYDKI